MTAEGHTGKMSKSDRIVCLDMQKNDKKAILGLEKMTKFC